MYQKTFTYNSAYWNDKENFNLMGGVTGLDNQETKLPTYWNTSFTKICLGMKVGLDENFILLPRAATSLHSLISSGRFRATSLGRKTWKSLIRKSSLQRNCNKEGFNTRPANGNVGAKIGIVSNQENDCASPDSVIGFGMGTGPFGKSCGNGAVDFDADNGRRDTPAMCFIFVQ